MTSDFMTQYPMLLAITYVLFWYDTHLIFTLNLTYKPENKWKIISVFTFSTLFNIILGVINTQVEMRWAAIIGLFMPLLAVAFYKGSFQAKFQCALASWGVIAVFEIFATYFCVFLFNTDIQSHSQNAFHIAVANLLSKLLPLVFLIFYHSNFKTSTNMGNFLTSLQALGFFSIPLISAVLIGFLHTSQISGNVSSYKMVIVVCLSLILINTIFFLLFSALTSSMKKYYEHELLELQVGYYENLYHNVGEERIAISTLRHNIKNDLLALKSSYTTGNMVGLEEELNRLLEDSSLENHRTSIIPIVDAVLGYKISQGKKLGVSIEHQQELSPELQVSNSHLANILGNALDNAIEYCCELEQVENRIVHLNMKKSANNLIITVSNPFQGEVEFLEDLPLSTKREKQSHGIGLRTIRSVTKELGGHFSVETENNTFTLKVIIYHCYP